MKDVVTICLAVLAVLFFIVGVCPSAPPAPRYGSREVGTLVFAVAFTILAFLNAWPR